MYLRSLDRTPLIDSSSRVDNSGVEQLLTPPEIAELCRVSVKTVLRAIHAGRLTASRLGTRGTYRIRAADVDAWLAGTVVEPIRRQPAPIKRGPIEILPTRPASGGSGRLRVTERMERR